MIYQTEKLLLHNPDPTYMLFYASEICQSIAYCMYTQDPDVSRAHHAIYGITGVYMLY